MNFEGLVERTMTELVKDARRSPRLLIGDSSYRAPMRGPDDVVAAWPELRYAEREVFGILLLNARMMITRRVVISIGSLNASIVHPREVFRVAILYSAASIVLVHNHPSGDAEPSYEDIGITRRLRDAGVLLGIEVLDHIIITATGHESFRARDLVIGEK